MAVALFKNMKHSILLYSVLESILRTIEYPPDSGRARTRTRTRTRRMVAFPRHLRTNYLNIIDLYEVSHQSLNGVVNLRNGLGDVADYFRFISSHPSIPA